nr:uncharacterized protein LOC113818961 [Penaeus vannamei]
MMGTRNFAVLTTLNIFRRTEKLSFRSKKLQKDIRFLRLCKNYHVTPNFVNFRVHNPIFYLYFEKLCASLKNCDIYNNNFNNVTNNITTIANNSFRKLSQQRRLGFDSDVLLSPLQTLKNDNTIVITKPDKGRGVVILNKCDYEQKLMDILSDKTKFKQITTKISTHLLYLEDKLNRLLRTIKASININTYNSLMTSGSRPGVLYGLPKVHKPNIPLRPIISSIGTFNYNTAKFLVPIISPLTSNQYTIDNSTSFVKEITSLNFQQPVTMASFDVESLFTNVPLQETTELIANNLDNTYLDKHGLDTITFKKLLEITAHHSVFTFNDCLYAQTDGVAMGSPLGPSYANAFLYSLGFRQKTEELSLQMSVQIFVYCDLSCQYITNGFTYVYLSTSYRHSVDTTTHSYHLLNSCLTRGVPVAITTEKDGTSLTQRATVTVTSSKYPSGPVCQP